MGLEELLSNGARTTIAASGLCVVAGVVLIKSGFKNHHKKAMAAASVLALVFVALYIIKSSLFPPERYTGNFRGLYLTVLWSHTVLSLVNFPLAAFTIYLALKKRFERHRKIAPYTAGVWIYVAASGWAVFLFNM